MNDAPAPESMIAVQATVFVLKVEKRVMGTRNSFDLPTVLVYKRHVGEADVAAVLRFKNPLGQLWTLLSV